jgi:DNA polymerase-3 subunit epsilon
VISIHFDTETTGLPDWKTPSEGPDQPHIVELAAILVDEDTKEELDSMCVIVKPDGWSWDDSPTSEDKAFLAHRITMQRAMDEGIPEKDAIEQFIKMWGKCDRRVSFNTTFDNRIIRIGLKRYFSEELAEAFKTGPYFCSMLNSCGPMRQKKWPTLEEAYKHFTGKALQNAHSAMADTRASMEVYFEILAHNKQMIDAALAGVEAEEA